MRIPFLSLFIFIVIIAGIDRYIYLVLAKRIKNRILSRIQLYSSIILLVGLVSFFFLPLNHSADSFLRAIMWIIFIYINIYVPKTIFVLFDFIAGIPILWHKKRWKWCSITGLILSAILFFALWWGALINRYNIDVNKVDVEIKSLPNAFNNLKIVQISDLHVGTFGRDTTFLDKLVKEVNSLNPDIIFFTGDIVNRKSSELEPFVNILSDFKSKYGVYSILGNHDYGDYYKWNSEPEKEENMTRLVNLQDEMGWNLLKNDYAQIVCDSDTLIIIGVENIGDPPFHVYGNLQDAYKTPNDKKTKILLTHNPAHWVTEIANSDFNIGLTLSGHTHAMQMSLAGFSPACFRYKTWGGLYQDNDSTHQLYVNIGAGTVGFPARIGATPEITLITLRQK